MNNISSIIEVFRMTELEPKTRVKIIKALGGVINGAYGMNLTEPIVYELVKILDPSDPIMNSEHYLRIIGLS